MAKKGWHLSEEIYLIENYNKLTIKELSDGLLKVSNRSESDRRSDDSINAKIKRLKFEGRIRHSKSNEAVSRSLKQRRK